MNDSTDRARWAAAKALEDFGRELPLDAEDAALAVSAYGTSLLADHDLSAFREPLTEHSDSRMRALGAVWMLAVNTNRSEDHRALGALLCDMAVDYWSPEVAAATAEYMEDAA